jgi:hypothetical protein
MKRLALLSSILVAAASTAGSAQAPDTCRSNSFRALDPWAGTSYLVTPEGRLQGEIAITPVVRGCGMWEVWHGVSGGHGYSYSVQDRATNGWYYMFANDTGVVVTATGRARDDTMRWRVTHLSVSHSPAPERWIWIAANQTRTIETSPDSGRSWKAVSDLRYVRWGGRLPPNSRTNGPCHSVSAYRSLDDLVGEWDVEVDGVPAGRSVIDTLLQGCVIRERRTGRHEEELRLAGYDVAGGVWRELATTSGGAPTLLQGMRAGSEVAWRCDGAMPPSACRARRILIRGRDVLVVRLEGGDRVIGPGREQVYRRRR